MSTKERAAQMRKEFKALGWNSKKIGVRTEYFSMGSAIHVTVKDASVDYATAKRIAEAFERIHRCEITGEILNGGNCYLHFGMTEEVKAKKAEPFLPAVEAAMKEVEALIGNATTLIPVGDTGYYLGQDRRTGWGCSLWDETSCTGRTYPRDEHGARAIALEIAMMVPKNKVEHRKCGTLEKI